MKEITSDQVARQYFGNFFVPFEIPKIIVVDVDRHLWNVLEDFSRDLTDTGICSCKVKPQVNYK